ncbi:hypothetical protein CPJCM30710_10910 [Clostridium polyendosporum]|uniref:DUF2922 family protein n=1 Tax=Clostridium polyendosporum TaxID=69208 RepID=A0A919VFH4_9CLOT|nr:DUF2922 domain-containing protein [Clostridium polyendosporum]GIM28425.1 hypothetical protein CPJCM30710_10910 [Clostridium polyendosporum]
MEYSLAMTFVTTSGDKASLTITGVKNDISQAEVSSLMDTIIAKDIFLTKGGTLISKYGAQLTQRQTTKFNVQ